MMFQSFSTQPRFTVTTSTTWPSRECSVDLDPDFIPPITRSFQSNRDSKKGTNFINSFTISITGKKIAFEFLKLKFLKELDNNYLKSCNIRVLLSNILNII